MDLQTIGLIIIGTILLGITGAFILSPAFRRDVIASEGEASILGLFNVKGVVIILLIAIFAGSFIYIIRGERSELAVPVNPVDSTHKVSYLITLGNHKKKIEPRMAHVCEVNAFSEACRQEIPVRIGRMNEVNEIPDFYYRIDSVVYTGAKNHKYEYYVSFAERVGGDTVWRQLPSVINKTRNGEADNNSRFLVVTHNRWARQYKVLITLGQPDSLMRNVERASLTVAAAGMELK